MLALTPSAEPAQGTECRYQSDHFPHCVKEQVNVRGVMNIRFYNKGITSALQFFVVFIFNNIVSGLYNNGIDFIKQFRR